MSAEPSNPLYELDAQNAVKGDSAMDLIEDLKMDNRPASNGLIDVEEVADTNGHDEQLVENGLATNEEIDMDIKAEEPVEDVEEAEPQMMQEEDQIVPEMDEAEVKPESDEVLDDQEEVDQCVVEDTEQVQEEVEEEPEVPEQEPEQESEPVEQEVEQEEEQPEQQEPQAQEQAIVEEGVSNEPINDTSEEASGKTSDEAEKDVDTTECPDVDMQAPEIAICPPDYSAIDDNEEVDLQPEENDHFDNADEAEEVKENVEPEAADKVDDADVQAGPSAENEDMNAESKDERADATQAEPVKETEAEPTNVDLEEVEEPIESSDVAPVETVPDTAAETDKADQAIEAPVSETADSVDEVEAPVDVAEPANDTLPGAVETEPVAKPEEIPGTTEHKTDTEPALVEEEVDQPKDEPITSELPEPVVEQHEAGIAAAVEPAADVPEIIDEAPVSEPEEAKIEASDAAVDQAAVLDEPAVEEPEVIAEPTEELQVESKGPEEDLQPADLGTGTGQGFAAESSAQEQEENAAKFNGNTESKENGLSEEDAIHFAEMNNVRQKFESGKTSEQEPPKKTGSIRDEFDQGGEYESTPVKNPDVVRETDHFGEELPEVGTAKNLLNKFKSIQEEKAANVASQRRQSPPKEVGKVEYTNEPTQRHEQYVGKSEEGEFESQPKQHADVVRSGDRNEDVIPEKGSAKNIMNKFKEIQSGSGEVRSPERREITPDRSGKVEYVSEPRGEHIVYEEAKGDSGVFESTPKVEEGVVRSGDAGEEVLPQAGSAKTLLNKFKQYESEAANRPPPSPKREITPDKSGKVEYVSEPRGFLEKYEPQCESGVYENQPNVKAEVVRSGERSEEYVPEAGTAKKTLERFKEIQTHGSSSTHSSKPRQSFTPPRELSPGRSVSGVSENQPQVRPDVVRSGEAVHEDLPEQGTAKNILNKFREIQSGSASPVSPQRKPKEFTPPPESGVYENKPTEHIKVENDQQTFSGILENTPTKSAADVPASREPLSPEQELPESGLARNLVSKFRQLETSSNTSKSASPKFKEFTPPRDSRGPLSPKSPAGATTNGVHPSDLPGQYQQQEQAAIYENEPETKSDVYREADTDWNEGLPKPNTTASMLERFKTMQQKAAEDQKTPSPISRKAKNVQYE